MRLGSESRRPMLIKGANASANILLFKKPDAESSVVCQKCTAGRGAEHALLGVKTHGRSATLFNQPEYL
jgi:hypothetical protein